MKPPDEREDLRGLLNSFFQDVDNENKVDSQTANALVSVHLKKIEAFISRQIAQAKRETIEEVEKIAMPDIHARVFIVSVKDWKKLRASLQEEQGEKV